MNHFTGKMVLVLNQNKSKWWYHLYDGYGHTQPCGKCKWAVTMLNSPLTIIKLISITLNEHFGIYGYNYRISNKKKMQIFWNVLL